MHGFIYFFITHSFNTLPLWPWAGWRIEAGVEEQTEDSNTVEVKTPYVIRNLRSRLAWGLYQSYTAQWWLDNDTVFYRLFHVSSLYHVFVSGLSVPIHEKKTTVTEIHAFAHVYWTSGLPRWHSAEEPTGQCRRHRRRRFDPWVMMIPWRRKWQPLQHSCLENSRDRQVWRIRVGPQRVRHNWAHARSSTHTHTHIGTMSCQVSISEWPCLIAWKACTAFEMHPELSDNHTLTFFSKLFSHSTLPPFVFLKLEISHIPDEPRTTMLHVLMCESRSVMSDSLRPHGLYNPWILYARILEWVASPFSRGFSQPRDQTQVCLIAGRLFTTWATAS